MPIDEDAGSYFAAINVLMGRMQSYTEQSTYISDINSRHVLNPAFPELWEAWARLLREVCLQFRLITPPGGLVDVHQSLLVIVSAQETLAGLAEQAARSMRAGDHAATVRHWNDFTATNVQLVAHTEVLTEQLRAVVVPSQGG